MAHECTVPLMQVGCTNDIIRFTTKWSHVSAAYYAFAIAITPGGKIIYSNDDSAYFVWNGSAFGAAINKTISGDKTAVLGEAACIVSEQEIWFAGYGGATRTKCI